VVDAARDGAAEDPREHRGEEQRLDGHVEELLEVAAHLHGGAPRERHGLGDGGPQADALRQAHGRVAQGGGEGGHRMASSSGEGVGESVVSGAPDAVTESSPVPWPVRTMNTSSRDGFWTLTESIAMPRSRRLTSTSTACSLRSSARENRRDS